MKESALKADFRHIVTLLKQHRLTVILVIILGVFVSVTESLGITMVIPLLQGIGGTDASLFLPFPLKQITSFFSVIPLKPKIQLIAVFLVLIVSIKGLLGYLNSLLMVRFQQDTIKHYRMLCINQLMRLKMGQINLQRFGHIQSLILNNTMHLGGLIYNCVAIIPNILTTILLLVILLLISWKMTLLAVALGGVSVFILKGIGHKAGLAGESGNKALQHINATLLDILMGMKVIRLFNREKDMMDKFDRDAEECKKHTGRLDRIQTLITPLFEFTGVTSLALIMISSVVILGHYGNAFLQILLVFLFIFFRLMPQVNFINKQRVYISGFWPFMSAIHRFIEQKDGLYIKNGTRKFLGLGQGIELRRVRFRYDSTEAVVLNDISCFIPKGAKIGIVGPSGGGKSTLTELLLRFYDPIEGQIFVDGVDLKGVDVYSWRKCVGVVTQETFLFNDTVRANITFSCPESTDEQIETALRRAHAYDFVKDLPQGLDTVLGERGVRLSGGQKQRLAIARAIISNPEVLIFDEATSSLDVESERVVQTALDEVGEGRTVITIAHRLSTVSDADTILVISEGRLVQEGSHQELLQEEGIYSRLVRLQTL